MGAERMSLVTSLPWSGGLLRRVVGRRQQPAAPVIVAPRFELRDERLGQLSYLTNAGERTLREPPLLLIHAPGLGASAHDLRRLFESFRDARVVYAPDLPGFGDSVCRGEPLNAELYTRAIERMLDLASARAEGGVDVVAIGLSAEFAAKVAAQRPDVVRSLALLNPTGFGPERERGALESAARHGKTPWSLSVVRRLGLGWLLVDALSSRVSLRYQRAREGLPRDKGTLHQASAAARRSEATRAGLAYLAGALYPRESPLVIYTRVHCPTLVVTSQDSRARFDELPRFAKWRDHFTALTLPRLDLGEEADCAPLADSMRTFWDGPGRRSMVC